MSPDSRIDLVEFGLGRSQTWKWRVDSATPKLRRPPERLSSISASVLLILIGSGLAVPACEESANYSPRQNGSDFLH